MTAEFESATENTVLKDAIIARIEANGGISFRDFMAMALYEPRHGYYTSERAKMGREGDYLTSPEVSPLFGAMIGRQLREMLTLLGNPDPFTVVEYGAGNGTLARDILSWARRTAPELYDTTRYVIADVSEALRRRQAARLAADGLAERVAWNREIPEAVTGCILSNELLDAMPVHRVFVEHGRLREVFVSWDGAGFAEDLREPSGDVQEYLERLGLLPGEGCHAEVNPAAMDWTKDAARALRAGFLMTFDYGYDAEELYAPWRKDGTLLGFYRHNPTTDYYARIGHQDLTSHVDFTSVRHTGEEAGLSTVGLVSQVEFLTNLGIHEALEAEANLEERFARRRAVMELTDVGGLGRIKVLAQARGVSAGMLSGLAGTELR